MLKVVDLASDATPQDCADAVRAAWTDNKVIHLKGLRPEGDLRAFYGTFFAHVGHAERLAEDARINDRSAQRTGEIWFEVRYDPEVPDAYRHSANPQPLHTDGSYIPGFPNCGFLACQAMPAEGGATVFIDSVDLVEILRRKAPDLLDALERTPMPHARSGDRRVEPVVRYEDDEPLLNWNFYCVDDAAGSDAQALRARLFEFLASDDDVQDRIQRVKLSPGEAVLWKDDRTLHGRDGFDASTPSERFLWKAAVQIELS